MPKSLKAGADIVVYIVITSVVENVGRRPYADFISSN